MKPKAFLFAPSPLSVPVGKDPRAETARRLRKPAGLAVCEAADGPPATAATVLFVSGDDRFRSTMRAFLQGSGLQVRSCADAARIPELFFNRRGSAAHPSSSPRGVDLLLIDVDALGATGLRLAAELSGFEPDLPVVVIGAPEAEATAFRALSGRGWKFLHKPVLLPRLLELIYQALGPRWAAAAPSPADTNKTSPRLLKSQGSPQ